MRLASLSVLLSSLSDFFFAGMEARYNCCFSIHKALAITNPKSDSALAGVLEKVLFLKSQLNSIYVLAFISRTLF